MVGIWHVQGTTTGVCLVNCPSNDSCVSFNGCGLAYFLPLERSTMAFPSWHAINDALEPWPAERCIAPL